jgi:PIN domain nuclease of toxin-antitoxin system
MTSVVADTHTLIWYLGDTNKLSTVALAALDRAINTNNPIYVSAISLVEIVYLIEKGRLPSEVLTRIFKALDAPDVGLALTTLDRHICEKLQLIDRNIVPDMPDRIIAATTLHLAIPLVSRDHQIHNLTTIQTIW